MVSYKKLFKLLIDKNMKQIELRAKTGLSSSTMAKLKNGENVNMSVVASICLCLDCKVDDILDIIPDEEVKLDGT